MGALEILFIIIIIINVVIVMFVQRSEFNSG